MVNLKSLLVLLTDNWAQVSSFAANAVLAGVAAYYARRSFLQDKLLVSRRPNLRLVLYGQSDPGRIILVLPFSGSDVFLVPLTLDVRNTGELSATNVEMYLELPDVIYGRSVPRNMSRIAEAKGFLHAAEEGTTEHMTTAYFSVQDISPRSAFRVVPEIILRRPTQHQWEVKGPDRKGRTVQVKGLAHYAWSLRARVACRNSGFVDLPVSIEAIAGQPEEAAEILRCETNEALLKSVNGQAAPKQFTVVAFGEFSDDSIASIEGKSVRVRSADPNSAVVLTARLR